MRHTTRTLAGNGPKRAHDHKARLAYAEDTARRATLDQLAQLEQHASERGEVTHASLYKWTAIIRRAEFGQ